VAGAGSNSDLREFPLRVKPGPKGRVRVSPHSYQLRKNRIDAVGNGLIDDLEAMDAKSGA
jgi:hypothetical protein